MRSVLLLIFASFILLQPSLSAQPARTTLKVSGGLSVPLGSFADRDPDPLLRPITPREVFRGNGGAHPGPNLWADLTVPIRKSPVWGWITSLGVIYQPVQWHEVFAFDESAHEVYAQCDAWWFLMPVTGLQSRLRLHPRVTIALFGQVGALLGRRPGMTIQENIHFGTPESIGEYTYQVEPSRAVDPVWSIGMEGQFFQRIHMNIRYLQSIPVYSVPIEVTSTAWLYRFLGSYNITHRIRQPIEMIQGTIGLIW